MIDEVVVFVPSDHFSSLLHCKLDVALMIGLLSKKTLHSDLIDQISNATRALLQKFHVGFQSKWLGCVEVGHELEYPWGTFSQMSKFSNKLLHIIDFEESLIWAPKFH